MHNYSVSVSKYILLHILVHGSSFRILWSSKESTILIWFCLREKCVIFNRDHFDGFCQGFCLIVVLCASYKVLCFRIFCSRNLFSSASNLYAVPNCCEKPMLHTFLYLAAKLWGCPSTYAAMGVCSHFWAIMPTLPTPSIQQMWTGTLKIMRFT